jgi:ParB family chromosome partitioning protein
MAKSFRDMTRDGDSKTGVEPTIKRTDSGLFIRRKNIHVRGDFNRRFPRQELTDHIRSMADTIKAEVESGAKETRIPKLYVMVREDGGVWACDGHCRLNSYDLAAEEGAPVEWIGIEPFTGTLAEAKAYTINSDSQLHKTPYERAADFKDLRDDPQYFIDGKPLTTTQIAVLTNFKRQYVEQLLKVADAPEDVKEAVLNGDIAAGLADDLIRAHGDDASAVIKTAVATAKSQGKKAATKATVQGRPIPRALADDLSTVAMQLRDSLPPETKQAVQSFRDGDDNVQVTIDIRSLNRLLALQDEIDRVRQDQADKASKKAAAEWRARNAEEESEHA